MFSLWSFTSWAKILFSRANRMLNRYLVIHEEYQINAARAVYHGWTVHFKVMIASYQHLFNMRGFTNICGYT